mgnify:CR=1 FL=1
MFTPRAAWCSAIGPECGSCYGSTYSLYSLGLAGATETTETWRISYAIDTARYLRLGFGDYIGSVAVKVASEVVAAALIAAPGLKHEWNVSLTGLANAGCGSGGGGWVCAEGGPAAADGSTHEWLFDITVARGALIAAPGGASVKANYEPPSGWITSEAITLTEAPEPCDAGLLGAGLSAASLAARRRRARRGGVSV